MTTTLAQHDHPIMKSIILHGVVGSTAHGTGMDGHEDRDEMGVYVESREQVCGLTPFDHYIYRTQPEGVRSGPGDLDLMLYSLRKFTRLAVQGNPSILLLLWLPEFMTCHPNGDRLVAMRETFVSREAGQRFLGYLVSQRMRLTGEKCKEVSRPELVAKFGYDTKFAMHALRLGLQGAELLRTRNMHVPVAEPDRTTLRAVRYGEVPFADALKLIHEAESNLKALVDACTWDVDRAAVDRFLVDAHHDFWSAI